METRGLTFSILLHTALLLIAAFGAPILMSEEPEPMPLVMTVDLVPIGEITNVKPSEKPITEEKKAQAPKTAKPVTPSAREKPTPPPEPKPEPIKDRAAFDPMKEEPAPPEKPKPTKEEKPKEEPKPKKDDDFAALLNQLRQENAPDKSKTAKDTTNTPENKTRSDAPYDDSLPLSISEKDAIRSQFLVCWTMPSGAKNAHTLAVKVKVTLNQDGSVMTAEIASDQMGRYSSDTFFRAAADSAVRAVHKCSPLKNLPPDKYGSWREMELNFDPQDAL